MLWDLGGFGVSTALTHEQVSSKYLDLTKKKLELTRLPHELLLPPAREWENGTPKSEVEPLIDFWYVRRHLLTRATVLLILFIVSRPVKQCKLGVSAINCNEDTAKRATY